MPATRRDRVLAALTRALTDADSQPADGWVCGRSLAHPRSGGRDFRARVSELRRAGWVIESRTCWCPRCQWAIDQARSRGEQPPYGHCYRLVDGEDRA